MTKDNDLNAARAALKAADDAMIAEMAADLDTLKAKADTATAETAEGATAILTIRNHLNHLKITLVKSHGVKPS